MLYIGQQRVSNSEQKLKKDVEPFGHNFEAIVSFRVYADKKDPIHVYKINDCTGQAQEFRTVRKKIVVDMPNLRLGLAKYVII